VSSNLTLSAIPQFGDIFLLQDADGRESEWRLLWEWSILAPVDPELA
tara:strand:+ start:37353 stop:37493 length:141 start_codon:yes stop_codon:yes gene_type:complete